MRLKYSCTEVSSFIHRICHEFYDIRRRALKEPESTEELMELTSFIENARTMGMLSLNERIHVRVP